MNVDNTVDKDEISFKEILQLIGSYITYLISVVEDLIVGIIGAILA